MSDPNQSDTTPKPKRRGRPRFKPAESDRRLAQTLSAFGVPEEQIARNIGDNGISPKTLRKYLHRELATGIAKANAKLGETLFQMGTDGQHPAVTIFLAKVRLGMRERAPIPSVLENQKGEEDNAEDSKAVTDELARLAADREAAAVPGETDQEPDADPEVSVEGVESPS
jgi:hypothetical protein